jgi:hypothetical protein
MHSNLFTMNELQVTRGGEQTEHWSLQQLLLCGEYARQLPHSLNSLNRVLVASPRPTLAQGLTVSSVSDTCLKPSEKWPETILRVDAETCEVDAIATRARSSYSFDLVHLAGPGAT